MSKRIVINACYGGFSLSQAAVDAYNAKTGANVDSYDFCLATEKRADPVLVETVLLMGAAANGSCASLKVVEIPDDVEWSIEVYDGAEWVAEKHRTWS